MATKVKELVATFGLETGFVVFVVFITAINLLDCVHSNSVPSPERLAVARASCDRDGGQWVIEYDMNGSASRYACIHSNQ